MKKGEKIRMQIMDSTSYFPVEVLQQRKTKM